jgi:hypothetical protein
VAGSRIDQPHPTTDWLEWHQAYDDPDSVVSRRLVLVRAAIARALDAAGPGPIRLLSICAGDGRDVLGVLGHHARARDVSATLVELHPDLGDAARATALAQGLDQVRCETGDAGLAQWYEGARPIDVLVACGVFGNVSNDDLLHTVRAFGVVVAPGGHVIWTRHRIPPDQTPTIRRWFGEAGFEEVSFEVVEGSRSSVGCHRRGPASIVAELPARLFEFVGDGSGAHR